MKLTLTLLLVLAIFSIAVALKCHSVGPGGEVLQTCGSADDQCGIMAIHSTDEKMENIAKITLRSCIPSAVCDILNGRTFSVTSHLSQVASSFQCCKTDGCNSATGLDFPDVGKPNGQQCKACADLRGMVCNMTVQCFGAQDRCYEIKLDESRRLYGCVTSNLCTLSKQQYEALSSTDFKVPGLPTCSNTSPYNSALTISPGLFPLLLGLVVLSVN